MRSVVRLVLGLVLSAALFACGGRGGPANPPTDLAATAGDGHVTLTWTMEPDVEYWVFYAPADAISTENWTTVAGARALVKQQSPAVVSGLLNGTTYAFTVNGRYAGGPGGIGAPSVTAVPRLAGATWTAATPVASTDLRAATFGKAGSDLYMVAGLSGVLASSSDGSTWTAQTVPVATTNFHALAYGGSSSFVAGGDGGALIYSTDGTTWTAATTNPLAATSAIFGLAANGSNSYVGVGSGGVIVKGSGANWSMSTSATGNDLYAVAYGGGRYVAVGALGTVLTSSDGGATWQSQTAGTSANLHAIAYGKDATTGLPLFVAAGAGGVLLNSSDGGLTWLPQTALPVANINSITYGSQFVLVGDGGAVYTSTTGATWTVATDSGTATSVHLYAATHNAYSYLAVGQAGANLLSK